VMVITTAMAMATEPSLYLMGDTEVHVIKDIFSDARRPPYGKYLTDCIQGILHHVSLDGVLTVHKSSVVMSLDKYLEERDRIFPAPRVRVNAVLQEEPIPSDPMVIHCSGTLSSDCGADLVENSVGSSEKHICLRS
jgi:hypothetical protein